MSNVANFVKVLHIVSLFFILFGWALPQPFWLPHVTAVPLVMLHWWTNKGQCVLTQLEARLRGQKNSGVQGEFVSGLFGKIGLAPSDLQMMLVIYSLMFISALASAYRLGWF